MTSSPKMSERLCGKSDRADGAEKVCADAGPRLSGIYPEFGKASVNERPVAAGAASSEVATCWLGEATAEQPLGVASARTSWRTGVGWSGAGAMDGRPGGSIEVAADIDSFDARYGVLQEEPCEAMDGGAGGSAFGLATNSEALDARYGQEEEQEVWSSGGVQTLGGPLILKPNEMERFRRLPFWRTAEEISLHFGHPLNFNWRMNFGIDDEFLQNLVDRKASYFATNTTCNITSEFLLKYIKVQKYIVHGAEILAMYLNYTREANNPRWRRTHEEVLKLELSPEERDALMLFDMMSVAEEEEILRGEGGNRHRSQSGSSIGVDDDGILLPEPILNEELLETSMEKACIAKEKEERRAITAERSRKRRMREQSQAPKVKSPRLEALVEENMEVEEQGPPPHEETQSDTLDTLEFLEKAMPDMEILEDDDWRDTPLPDEDDPISPRESRNLRRRHLQEDERSRSRSRSPNYATRSPSPPRRSPRPRTPPVPDYHSLAQNLSQSVLAALEWFASSSSHGRDTLDLVLKLRRASSTLSRIQKISATELKIDRVEKDLERINRLLEEVAPQPIQQQPPTRRYPV